MVLDEQDLCNLAMQGYDVPMLSRVTVHPDFDLQRAISQLENPGNMIYWTFPSNSDISVPTFDAQRQQCWFMPEEYKTLDIAQYVLGLCKTPEQLQRCGQELLLYQDRDMFDLLRYLKYLVDVMKQHKVIWGVGRGSSVASYVLYLMEVHRVDSMFYDLDPDEFLR